MGDEKSKITPEEWKARLEANRKLRVQYAEDPSKLTEDEKTRAMVLLQRDQRKVRQQQEKKKQTKSKAQEQVQAVAAAPQVSRGDIAAPPKASKQTHETLREPIEPEGGYADDDPRKEWADSLRDAIAEKKRRKREERGFKTKAEMGWAPQLKGKKLEEQQDIRARFAADPQSLSAAERERAEVLLARDARKRTKKAQRIEQRAKREAAKTGGVVPTDAQKSLAKKWGFSEKMAAAASDRLKKGLKRGDWECPKCSNKNFARRDKCLKCDEPVPSDHSRWASFGSKEFEHHDEQFWQAKQKEHLESTGAAVDEAENSSKPEEAQAGNLWNCKKCGIGNADTVSVCFRCGKHKGSKKFAGETLAGKIAAASGAPPPVDKRKERDAKKAARLGAKLSNQAEAASAEGSSSDESSSGSGDETVTQADASKKRKKPTETGSSDESSSSDSSDSSSDDDDDKVPQKDIGFTGSGRDTSGDWTCPRCSNLNWNNREKCNRCPQLRGEKPPPTPEELKKQAADKKRRKKQAAKDAAAASAVTNTIKKPVSARGNCVLGSKEPKDGDDVENKTYTCGGCGAVVKGASIAISLLIIATSTDTYD
eukprot:COSAG02_NODE_1229_length_13775_cov_35.321512_9_plen_595_part_00